MKSADAPHRPRTLDEFLAVFLSTCLFSSYIPVTMLRFMPAGKIKHYLSEHKKTGAGFIGSVCGLFTFLLLPVFVVNSYWAVILGFVLALWASHKAESLLGVKDDPRIIIDEWIGMWVAAWGFYPTWGGSLLLAFAFFRFFDVVKGPWGKSLQKLNGGWGILMDDVVAGLLANFCVRLVLFFF